MLWLTLWLIFYIRNVAYGVQNITVHGSNIFPGCGRRMDECISTASWRFKGIALYYIIPTNDFSTPSITIDGISQILRSDDFVKLHPSDEQSSMTWSITGLDDVEHEVTVSKGGSHWDTDTFIYTTHQHPTTKTKSLPYPNAPILVSNNIHRRADTLCLKQSTEGSCLNLAANCIDAVTVETQHNMWDIRSCAVAATCYGVADLVNSTKCQTGLDVTVYNQSPLSTTVYHDLVGNCSGNSSDCQPTQQNFVDWFYGTLSQINTTQWPSSPDIVTTTWAGIVVWSGTQSRVNYSRLDSWYHTACPNHTCHAPATHTLSRATLLSIIIVCVTLVGL